MGVIVYLTSERTNNNPSIPYGSRALDVLMPFKVFDEKNKAGHWGELDALPSNFVRFSQNSGLIPTNFGAVHFEICYPDVAFSITTRMNHRSRFSSPKNNSDCSTPL